jgi:hypothetical protein
MFNEQGCRIPAKIAELAALLQRTIRVRGLHFRAGARYRRDRPAMAINRNDDLQQPEKLRKPASFQPCSTGTSLDSFHSARQLTL